MHRRFTISPEQNFNEKSFQDLKTLLQKDDHQNIQPILEQVLEDCLYKKSTIHTLFDEDKKRVIGFGIFNIEEIEDYKALVLEYLFIEKDMRATTYEEINSSKLSTFFLDYFRELGIYLQKYIPINLLALIPVTDKIRTYYEEYGFTTLEGSCGHELEDYMTFPLIDLDMEI